MVKCWIRNLIKHCHPAQKLSSSNNELGDGARQVSTNNNQGVVSYRSSWLNAVNHARLGVTVVENAHCLGKGGKM